MPQDRSTPRRLSVHIKERWQHKVTEVGQAGDVEGIKAFMWGKNTAWYVLVIDDVEYDLETTDENIGDRIDRLIDIHEAFYADK